MDFPVAHTTQVIIIALKEFKIQWKRDSTNAQSTNKQNYALQILLGLNAPDLVGTLEKKSMKTKGLKDGQNIQEETQVMSVQEMSNRGNESSDWGKALGKRSTIFQQVIVFSMQSA